MPCLKASLVSDLRFSLLYFVLRRLLLGPFYPHQLFEVGEVAIPDMGVDLGSRTQTTVAAIIAYPGASFSEIHSYLDLLMYYLAWPYRLEPTSHRSFLEGRVGKILCEEKTLGINWRASPRSSRGLADYHANRGIRSPVRDPGKGLGWN